MFRLGGGGLSVKDLLPLVMLEVTDHVGLLYLICDSVSRIRDLALV